MYNITQLSDIYLILRNHLKIKNETKIIINLKDLLSRLLSSK